MDESCVRVGSMVFTSYSFLFYFLPAVLLVYYILPRGRNIFLLLASYIFYGWWSPWFVLLMLAVTLINYIAGLVIASSPSRSTRSNMAVAFAVIGSLGLLGFFKYFVFAAENLNGMLALLGAEPFSVWQIVLPIGISFYTFQSLSYTVDVYRGTSPPVRTIWDFACYVSLFPQLIAGPIVRYNTIAEQLVHRQHTVNKFSAGTALFIIGFAKKILLANPMGEMADASFAAANPGALAAWLGVTAYAFQIYFDFSGYSDMAIGLGRMLGFEFPRNFNAPYRALNITDFWRRWHISLSTFLRDYLYIPLGGNRHGVQRTYANLAIVMLLGGLWHGANWTFIAWGGFHGAFLIFERLRGKESLYDRTPRVVQTGITFVVVLISWVFFRSTTITEAIHFLGEMFSLGAVSDGSVLLSGQLLAAGSLLQLALCGVLVFAPWQAYEWVERLSWYRIALLLVLFMVATMTMFAQSFNPFLYFQF
jgi:alginate O-acetyltransferase complex protein AlgI